MYKKTITYIDYDGEERTEDHYFNLTQAELIDMELSFEGGMSKAIERISQTKNRSEIVKVFKELISKSYGQKSPDGKRFIKVDDNGVSLFKRFAETEAYSTLFMELGTDNKAAAEFVNSVIPKLDESLLERAAQSNANIKALNPVN